MSIVIWATAMLVMAGAATVQGAVGLGMMMIAVPVLSLLNPSLAPAPQLLVALPLTISMAWRERGAIDFSKVGWILAGRIPGAFIGVYLLGVASARALDAFIGVAVLAAVIVIGRGVQVRRTRTTGTLAGIASGASSIVSSIGGPAIALLYSRDEAATIRSTLAFLFTFGISTSVIFRTAAGHFTWFDVRVAGVLLPAVFAGMWVSGRIKDNMSSSLVRTGVLAVCASASAGLLIRAALG
ncbi:MAG: sulfite exporter TauE/SafE family protein [Actinomycetota bacterium]|nr:sulfite exporter TauE/SafE family protein [Actinomycetota bacterium]